jgi:peptidoglycan/LPS O-acetylase OafA/YrhL
VAILAVIAFHVGTGEPSSVLPHVTQWLGFGWCGVDLFFVLSGFLITGILIDTKETAHAFRNFYARRVLRIFPLYYLTLIVYFHVLPAAARLLSGFHRFQRTEELWYWLYVCNWSPSIGTAHALLTHLWSLSIEEQFYLFWPLLVFTLSRRSVGRLCAAVIVLTPCLRLGYLLTVVGGGSLLYRITLFRIDTLAFGALCALLVRDPGRLRLAMQARPILLAAAGIGLAASIAIGGTSSYLPPMNVIGFTSLAILFAYFILWAIAGGAGLRAVLRSGPLRSIGKYSYAMYIFHVPIVALLRRASDLARTLNPLAFGTLLAVEIAAAAALSYAAGFISWRLFENRFLQLKSRFEYHGKPTPAG